MVKYGVAASIILSLGCVESFGPIKSTASLVQRARVNTLKRHVTSPTLYDYEDENSLNIRATIGNLSASYIDSISEVVGDEGDPYEEELAAKQLKKKIVRERSGNYEVSLPIVKGSDLGMTLCAVDAGELSETDLNLDTLRIETPGEYTNIATAEDSGGLVQTMDPSAMKKRLGPTFKGVVVSSVVTDGKAWNKGIRPGHVLVATSATLGEALWPKSTVEGVRSAIMSRRNLSSSMTFEFQRVDTVGIAEQYELTVPRPIGLQLEETEDGYVQVSGFTESAPKLIKYAVRVGDRILAVDSIAGRMWPVSTVDGVISACTTRLPGRPVRFRFARPQAFATDATTAPSAEKVMEAPPLDEAKGYSALLESSATQTLTRTETKSSQDALLSRCRDVLRRYMKEAETRMNDKYALPAIVADRVLEALASASASFDAETLSLVMSAYLSCRKPRKAIQVFEAAVGLKGDGSSKQATSFIECEKKAGSRIVAEVSALDLYTGTCLLRAHALTGNFTTVQRILAAMEGRSGTVVNGVEVASWPGTGESGPIFPDTICYNTALGAAAKDGGDEGIDMALNLFDSMNAPDDNGNGPQKDIVSYNTVISLLAKTGLWRQAFDVFDRMNMAKVRPDKYTYTSLIKACVKDGDLEELLIDMKERGVEPDVVTYNTMIKALCDRYKWFEAKKLIAEMEQRGIKADSLTYGTLMNGLLRARKPAACLTLFETACSDPRTAPITENVYLYTTAIAATSALGNYERALDLVSRMTAAGVKPNLKTLTALMSSCLSSGKAIIATDVFRQIDSPDGYALVAGIRAFCDAGDLVAASEILSERRHGFREMSGKEIMLSYNTVIRSALERSDYSMARRTLSELLGSGYIPSKATYQAIVTALDLGPKRKNIIQQPPADDAFDFLLFVLDSIQRRNLLCDGSFYASFLYCGARIGGLRRKVASLGVQARALTDVPGSNTLLRTEQTDDRKAISGWEDLLLNYDAYKDEIGDQLQLPPLSVNVGNRNIRQVLSAERAVQYNSARKSTQKL